MKVRRKRKERLSHKALRDPPVKKDIISKKKKTTNHICSPLVGRSCLVFLFRVFFELFPKDYLRNPLMDKKKTQTQRGKKTTFFDEQGLSKMNFTRKSV